MEWHPYIVATAALVAIVLGIGAIPVRWILKEIANESANRANSAKTIIDGQASMKTDFKTVIDGHEKRLERIEEKSADFRSGKSIDEAIKHMGANAMQVIQGVRAEHDRTSFVVDSLKDRVTRLETQHEQTSKVVGEIKSELKETRHEINDRFDAMAKTQQQQFDQLCASIREARDTKFKG